MFFCSAVFCKGLRRDIDFGPGCQLLLKSAMGWLCGTATSALAADEDLDEEEMGLVRTEGPDLSPLECSSAAEVQSLIKGKKRFFSTKSSFWTKVTTTQPYNSES